jgi:antibiotic biosynthesis monooxygenase (ABM) superfamily enzyme
MIKSDDRIENDGVENNNFEKSSIEKNSFDNFLTQQFQQAQPYLLDDGFAAQVMGKLPAPKKLSVWQERLIIIIPFIIISLLVLSQFHLLAVVIKLWTLLMVVNVAVLLKIGLLTSIAVISCASFWFAKQFKLI